MRFVESYQRTLDSQLSKPRYIRLQKSPTIQHDDVSTQEATPLSVYNSTQSLNVKKVEEGRPPQVPLKKIKLRKVNLQERHDIFKDYYDKM